MGKKYLGTSYGGWTIDTDLIKDGDFVIDAGLGTDISFLEELNKIKKVEIIAVDPTEKSHNYVESLGIPNIRLIKKAIAPPGQLSRNIYKNSNPKHVSESFFSEHLSIDNTKSYLTSCISFSELISEFSPSLIKMDIEGAEFETLEECLGIKQICVEFHDFCMKGKSARDKHKILQNFIDYGYDILNNNQEIEYTLVLKKSSF